MLYPKEDKENRILLYAVSYSSSNLCINYPFSPRESRWFLRVYALIYDYRFVTDVI